jgi:hypothetical protein
MGRTIFEAKFDKILALPGCFVFRISLNEKIRSTIFLTNSYLSALDTANCNKCVLQGFYQSLILIFHKKKTFLQKEGKRSRTTKGKSRPK